MISENAIKALSEAKTLFARKQYDFLDKGMPELSEVYKKHCEGLDEIARALDLHITFPT